MKVNLVAYIEKIYSHLPKLPPQLRVFTASVLPPLSLIFGLLITLASLLEIAGTPFISILSSNTSGLPVLRVLLITNAIGVFQGLLMIFAWSPLKKRHEKGWRFLVWSQILWVVSAVLSLSGSVILALVLLYPIIEAKSEYK